MSRIVEENLEARRATVLAEVPPPFTLEAGAHQSRWSDRTIHLVTRQCSLRASCDVNFAFIPDMQSRKPTAGQAREHRVRKSLKDSEENR
jgi:hypothetical protein